MKEDTINRILTTSEALSMQEEILTSEVKMNNPELFSELSFLDDLFETQSSYKKFNFNSWTINFVSGNRKIVLSPATLFLFSNGTFFMRRDWNSNLYSYSRPSNKLFLNFHLKENNLTLDNDKLKFSVACGSGTSKFKGTFDSFYYPLINRITIYVQGYAYNCR